MAESLATETQQQPELRTLAISASFTSEPVREPLEFWIKELGLDYKIEFAPYNQVFQSVLDPGSVLARNSNGVNVLLVRLEDWAGPDHDLSAALRSVKENVSQLVTALQARAAAIRVPTIVIFCPSSPEFIARVHSQKLKASMEDLIRVELSDLSSVHLVNSDMLKDLYPVAEYYDAHGQELGHIPYTSTFFTALATLIARRIFALRNTPYKVIALDCDNTLWQGICGEDGPEAVTIDSQRRALQNFMVAQRDAGVLLTMCSRNNEADVLETFKLHPEMPLKLEHFAGWRINWEPKSTNLVSLAEELDLGLDSFIFIDDDLKECAEVEANCPDVLTLGLTEMGDDYERFLRHVWAFDHWKITEEDRRRSAMYAEQLERARFEKSAVNLEDFIAGLNLRVEIKSLSPEQLPRVAQLTQRTNQMNFTSVRRNEAEIDALIHGGELECLTVDVTDRFGSYGLTGVVLYTASAEALRVDTFLLSCRALGRGVEHRMLAHAAQIAGNRGLPFVDVPFIPSQRNQPALNFLKSIGARYEQPAPNGSLFRFPTSELVRLSYTPDRASVSAGSEAATAVAKRKKTSRTFSDFGRIAALLSEPRKIEEHIRGLKREAVSPAQGSAPRTDLERRLVSLWAKLLNVASVGVHDNFFDLGGHSLLAVQLLSRVRQEFGVDLSLEVVYSGTLTVAELAKAIELYELGQVDAMHYADLIAELEGLSDEEVSAMLAQEQEAAGGAPHLVE